jgi:hypothetical protein
MYKLTLGLLVIAMIMGLTESSSFAQGMGAMGGGGRYSRPKHRIHKPRAPALSPALNLLPEAATTFEGQFLLRQLPQEEAFRQYNLTGKALDRLQSEMTETENQVRTGVSPTGHSTQFMNYGSYYSFSGGRGGGGSLGGGQGAVMGMNARGMTGGGMSSGTGGGGMYGRTGGSGMYGGPSGGIFGGSVFGGSVFGGVGGGIGGSGSYGGVGGRGR